MITQSDQPKRPLYARVLRLRRLQLSGALCFLMFEGMIGLAVLLSLAELVTWWSVLVLPLVVAVLVKINDIVASAFAWSDATHRIPLRREPDGRGVAAVHRPARRGGDVAPDTDTPTQLIPRFGGRRPKATNERWLTPTRRPANR